MGKKNEFGEFIFQMIIENNKSGEMKTKFLNECEWMVNRIRAKVYSR